MAVKAYWESLFELVDGVASLSDAALTAYSSFFRLGLKSLASAQGSTDACRSARPDRTFFFNQEDPFVMVLF